MHFFLKFWERMWLYKEWLPSKTIISEIDQISTKMHEIFSVKNYFFYQGYTMDADSAIFYADCRMANTFDAHV